MRSKLQYTRGVVGLLVIIATVGLGILFLVEYCRLPGETFEKMIMLIVASALLPAGLLWSIEHYFLVKPMQDEYDSMIHKIEERIDDLNAFDAIKRHGLREISTERGDLVKKVLFDALDDQSVHEIILVGSTQNGLTRRARWFQQFVYSALEKGKTIKMIFTHWKYITDRERQEDRPNGAIAQEMKASLHNVITWGIPKECIRLAYGAPTVFMAIAGDNMILNPYPFCGESVTSATLWLTNPDPETAMGPPGSIWREFYINHYDKPWNPTKPEYKMLNNDKPDPPLSIQLPDDWEEQLDYCIQDAINSHEEQSA